METKVKQQRRFMPIDNDFFRINLTLRFLRKNVLTCIMALMVLPVATWAQLSVNGSGSYNNVTTIESAINSALGVGNVTVEGSFVTATSTLHLNIPFGRTVYWLAIYQGAATPLLSFTGDGTLVVGQDGLIKVTGSGNAINIRDNDAKIIVTGNGEVDAESGTTIYATGTNATVTVEGSALVSNNSGNGGLHPAIYIDNISNTGNNVFVKDNGSVKAIGIPTGSQPGGFGIETSGGVVVSGGEVYSTYGRAINLLEGATATVTGGLIYTDGTLANSAAISSATSANTNANVVITGGIVAAKNGYAIHTTGATSTVSITGGFVFAYGTGLTGTNNVIFTQAGGSSSINSPSGDAVVVAWNYGAWNTGGNLPYGASTSNHLTTSTNGKAVWGVNSAMEYGIFYEYNTGTNKDFFILPVIVNPLINGLYLVFEDYFGNMFSSAPEMYNNFNDINDLNLLSANFQIPQGTVANVYAVYAIDIEDFYTNVSDWKDYIADSRDVTLTLNPSPANLTVGLPDAANEYLPLTGVDISTANAITAEWTGTNPNITISSSGTGTLTFVFAAAVESGPDDIDVIAPLIDGIYAVYSATPVTTTLTNFIVGDKWDTNPKVSLTGSALSPSLSGLIAGTDYLGTVALIPDDATAVNVDDYELGFKISQTLTISYEYTFEINGESRTITLPYIGTATPPYIVNLDIGYPAIEKVFLIAKDPSAGTLIWEGSSGTIAGSDNEYTMPFYQNSTIRLYPVVLSSIVNLDATPSQFLSLTAVDPDDVALYSNYFNYLTDADFTVASPWGETSGSGIPFTGTHQVDGSGYMYYEVEFTDEIDSPDYFDFQFVPSELSNNSAPFSTTFSTLSPATLQIYHYVDPYSVYNVTGTVTDGANPIQGATVTISDGTTTFPSVATDANGHFTIPNIPSGSFTVTVTKNGYVTGTTNVNVLHRNTDIIIILKASNYSVTYNAHGGTTAPVDNNLYLLNDKVTVLGAGNMKNSGFTFTGWNTKPDGNGISYKEGDVFTITDNVILYAQWEAVYIYHVLRYITVEPSINGNVTSNRVSAVTGEPIILTIIPDYGYVLDSIRAYRTDYDPITVTLKTEGNIVSFMMPAYDVTVTATFRLDVEHDATGTREVTQTNILKAYVQNGMLYVRGFNANEPLYLYNIAGTMVKASNPSKGSEVVLSLPGRGIYIVRSGYNAVKVVY